MRSVLVGKAGKRSMGICCGKRHKRNICSITFPKLVQGIRRHCERANSSTVGRRCRSFVHVAPYGAYGNRELGGRSLTIAITSGGVCRIAGLSVRGLGTFLTSVRLSRRRRLVNERVLGRVETEMDFLSSMKLSCLSLKHTAKALSNNRTREVHLTARVNSKLMKITCVLSRPDVKLRRESGSELLNSLVGLHSLKGDLVIIRRSRSAVHTTSYVMSVNPNTKRRNKRLITVKATRSLVGGRSSVAKTCLDKGLGVPMPLREQGPANFLAIGKTTRGGLGGVSIGVPLKVVAYVAKISNSNGDSLVGRVLCGHLTESLGQTEIVPKGRGSVLKASRLSGIVGVSRSPVNHAPHSGPTACAKMFSRVESLFTTATSTGTGKCGGKQFDFGMGNKEYRTYDNSNVVGVRVRFLPSMCMPYRIYGNGECGERALRMGCGSGGVCSILGVAIRRTLAFFRGIPSIGEGVRALCSMKLSCVQLKRPSARLSKKRTREVGLTARLDGHDANGAVCVLSRPAANLRFTSIRGLIRVLGQLSRNNGAMIIVRRGLSIVGATSCVVSVKPRNKSGKNAMITRKAPRRITRSPISCAKGCMGGCLGWS